ncbi:unnamed protein product, partial [Oikopleura dioica]
KKATYSKSLPILFQHSVNRHELENGKLLNPGEPKRGRECSDRPGGSREKRRESDFRGAAAMDFREKGSF